MNETAKNLVLAWRRHGELPRQRTRVLCVVTCQIAVLLCVAWVAAAPRQINTTKSVLTVHVHKAGVLSGLGGHDHEIVAPIATGTIDAAARTVETRVNAAALKVADSSASEKDRAEIQKMMLGPSVLDSERYSEIIFRSKSSEALGEIPGKYRVI